MQTIYKDKHPKQTNKKVNLSSIMIKKIEETKLSDIFLDKKSKMLIILDLKKKSNLSIYFLSAVKQIFV